MAFTALTIIMMMRWNDDDPKPVGSDGSCSTDDGCHYRRRLNSPSTKLAEVEFVSKQWATEREENLFLLRLRGDE